MAKKIYIGDIELAQKSEVTTALSSKQDTLVSGTNIKTINGSSILGSGNVSVNTFKTFGLGWDTSHTVNDFCASINGDASATEGNAYLGGVTFTDFPSLSLLNADIVVEVITGTGTSNKVIHIVMTSGSISPYHWEYTYWNNGNSTSGWIAFEPAGGGSGTTDYDDLSHLPIINQDLDELGFVPVSGTYYRHNGASSTNYAIGVIYYYDGINFNKVLTQGDVVTTATQYSTAPISSGAVYDILEGINIRLQNI